MCDDMQGYSRYNDYIPPPPHTHTHTQDEFKSNRRICSCVTVNSYQFYIPFVHIIIMYYACACT